MKKSISIISVCAALSTMLSMSMSVNAEEKTSTYTASLQLNRYAMTAEEAAAGNSVKVDTYVRGPIKDGLVIKSAFVGINHDPQLYMRDIVNPNQKYTENSYSYLNKHFNTSYKPFCFGVFNNGKYNSNTFTCASLDYCTEPVTGGYIYYRGNDTISFKLPGRYYVNENGELAQDKVSHEITCPLTVNGDGTATFSFKYANSYGGNVYVDVAERVIDNYQPELLNEGDRIPDKNNQISWIATLDASTSFLGNSDDFPLMQTNALFKKNTPCGIYDIAFQENKLDIKGTLNGDSYNLPMKYQTAAIAVGVTGADIVSESSIPEYACYYADDKKTITGASAGADYICNVNYSDGTSESLKNVTGAVNAGTSPNDIMSGNSGAYFIGDIPMYCGDTRLTYNGNENNIKALIGKKGDVNFDGKADITDALEVLRYYSESAAGLESKIADGEKYKETLAFFLGDVDTESQNMENGGKLDITDALSILSYYSHNAADIDVSWDKYLQ